MRSIGRLLAALVVAARIAAPGVAAAVCSPAATGIFPASGVVPAPGMVGTVTATVEGSALDGATVTVLARRDGADAVLTVRDTGPGLDADQLAHVFDRFYRIDAARARAQGGAGIGLAIVAALAGAMGGRAWAESDGPGRGAAFSVALPAA